MNNLQEEIVNVVLDAGIALNGAIENQMLQAIKTILQRGGTQTNFTIANNIGTPANVTGISFNKVTTKAARALFHLEKKTDSVDYTEVGEMFFAHDQVSDTWSVFVISHYDDAQVTFSITSGGQLQYTSNNMAGTNYSGTVRITNITTVAV